MENVITWLTPALILRLFGWLRSDMRSLKIEVGKSIENMNVRFNELKAEVARSIENMNMRFDNLTTETNRRFDGVHREFADLRERMAKLEGSIEGFLAGRRDRDAA